MPQTIDLYGPRQQAMAEALRILQDRQRMNEQRRQFDAAQGLDEQKMRMLQKEADDKAAWDAEQHDLFRRQFPQMAPWQQTTAAYNAGIGNSPNAEFVSRSAQNETLTPEQVAQRNLVESGNVVSPEDAAKNQATKDAAQIRANATVEAARIRRATSGGGTPRSPKAEKPFDVADHPQVKAYNQKLTELSRTEQKLIDKYNAAEKDGDKIPIVRQLNSLRATMKSFIEKRDEFARRLMAQRTALSHEEPDTVEPDADEDDNPLSL